MLLIQYLMSDCQHLDNSQSLFQTFHQLAQATVIDGISMNFYMVELSIRLSIFNF